MKIINIVGTRPQFIKAAAMSRAFQTLFNKGEVTERLIHTGQHYDAKLSTIFFDELKMPTPSYHLEVGSGSHALQTGEIMVKLETILTHEKPAVVLVYGDCNTTLAGALAAKKLNIPLAHVESGVRSFNRAMPEEINRIITDAIADFLYCPTRNALNNLKDEGNDQNAEFSGDVMYDMVLHSLDVARKNNNDILEKLALKKNAYLLCTFHRAINTDVLINLRNIVAGLKAIANEISIVLPLHPRTRAVMEKNHILIDNKNISVTEPFSYFDMLVLERDAKMIMTDSGGVQKEAFYFKKPCIVLREETEWVELIGSKSHYLVGADSEKMLEAYHALSTLVIHENEAGLFGDGHAAEKIAHSLVDRLNVRQPSYV